MDLKNLGLSSPKQNLLITKDTQSAKLLFEELKGEFHCLLLEGSELLPYDFFSSSPVTRASRLNCFSELTKQLDINLIVSVQTLLSPCPDISHVMPINNMKVGDKLEKSIKSLMKVKKEKLLESMWEWKAITSKENATY